jgi:hypothetical protein
LIRVEAGQRLRGRIAFSEFEGWPHQDGITDIQLRFPVRPRHC